MQSLAPSSSSFSLPPGRSGSPRTAGAIGQRGEHGRWRCRPEDSGVAVPWVRVPGHRQPPEVSSPHQGAPGPAGPRGEKVREKQGAKGLWAVGRGPALTPVFPQGDPGAPGEPGQPVSGAARHLTPSLGQGAAAAPSTVPTLLPQATSVASGRGEKVALSLSLPLVGVPGARQGWTSAPWGRPCCCPATRWGKGRSGGG